MNSTAAILSIAILAPLGGAAEHADRTVLSLLERSARVAHTVVLQRLSTGEKLDLVLAFGSGDPIGAAPAPLWWNRNARLGLFLQDRADPGLVYQIAIQPGPNDDCAAVLERMTAQDLVLSCTGEKSATYDNQKFVYDVRAKALVKYFSYPPFRVSSVRQSLKGPRFVMFNGAKLLAVDVDTGTGEPRLANAAEARSLLASIPMETIFTDQQKIRVPAPVPNPAITFGPGRQFSLSPETIISDRHGHHYEYPQSDLITWKAARPDYTGYGQIEIAEGMGPHQVEGNHLWFGKTFYDSEGASGVGGFGYFDAESKTFRIYAPPELAAWSISAMLVEPEFVWLALFRRGEYGDDAGGLLQWNRQTEAIRIIPNRRIISNISRYGDSLYLGGISGIDVLRGEQFESYFVDRTSDSRYRVAKRDGEM